jgi:hypothetical protein
VGLGARSREEVPKEVLDALLELEGRGWQIQRGGHKLQVYCPCGKGGAIFRVGGTLSNPGNESDGTQNIAQSITS